MAGETPREPAVAAALAASSIFDGLGVNDVARLASRMQPRHYERGEVIISQGDAAGSLHVVCSGGVKIATVNEDGKETVLAFLRPGEMFGELAALDGGPRSATVTALERTETAALAREELLTFIHSHGDFAVQIIRTLASRLRRLDERLEDAHFMDLDTRFARQLVELAETHGQAAPGGTAINLPLTQSELASMIGATRVSANRLLGAYQDAGLVRLDKRSLVVTDLRGLRARAGR